MTMADLIDDWEKTKTTTSYARIAVSLAKLGKAVRHNGFSYSENGHLSFRKVPILELVDAASVEIERRPDVVQEKERA